MQDTIYRLSQEITRRADKTSPSRISTLYRIEALLRAVSEKEVSNLATLRTNLGGDNAVVTESWIVGVGFNQSWLQV